MTDIIYPQITVNLTSIDGNAYSILGAVTKKIKRYGIAQSLIDEFLKEAESGDYDHLIQTVMQYVNVE